MNSEKQINNLIEKAGKDKQILAVFLFGSRARGEDTPGSDIDICLVLKQRKYSKKELSQKKLEYLSEFDLDIQIYQQLPLYIKKRVLKDGKILMCKNEDEIYEIAFKTIEEYSDMEHFYKDYLKEAAGA